MTPTVISVLNSLAESLSSLSVEISSEGRLCLSFSSGDVLSGEQAYDFSQPKEFYEELWGRTDLKKLETTLSSLQTLYKIQTKSVRRLKLNAKWSQVLNVVFERK